MVKESSTKKGKNTIWEAFLFKNKCLKDPFYWYFSRRS
jgi:hypothetical protein